MQVGSQGRPWSTSREKVSFTRDGEFLKIPPFADSHIHFSLDGRRLCTEELPEIIDTCQRHGIFSLRDMGHRGGIGLDAKKMLDRNVEIQSAGCAIYKTGGYGAFLGRGVSGANEIRKSIRDIAGAGADFIKVINSGIISTRDPGLVTEGGFSFDELNMICEEARKRDLEVACHANSDRAIRDAVRAGVSSIEHGFFLFPETLHMMAESGTSWTPTALALLALSPQLPPSEARHIEKIVDDHLGSLKYASSIGVRLRVGTDSGSKGVKHGESFLHELRLWQRAGLVMEQILLAACMDTGEVEKGNYLLVRERSVTEKIDAVYRGGLRVTHPDPAH